MNKKPNKTNLTVKFVSMFHFEFIVNFKSLDSKDQKINKKITMKIYFFAGKWIDIVGETFEINRTEIYI